MTITRNKRETGFELLRIIAMFLIGAVHIMNYGGMIANNAPQTVMWQKLIYAVFIVSVNVFVLISAYFMVTSKFKIKKIITLWLQVFFFSIVSYLIASLCIYNNFSFSGMINACFPILNNKFWFFTAYFILIFLSPFLNMILQNSSKKQLYLLCGGLLLLVFLTTKFPVLSVFNVAKGYSVFWFCILYLVGGTLRLHPLKIKKIYLLIIYLVSTLGLWGFTFLNTNNELVLFLKNSLDYHAPLAVFASISLFLLFKGVNVKNTIIHNVICFVSSLTFGIYLFQESYLKKFIYFNILNISNYYNVPYSALAVLLLALELFLLGMVIEIIRRCLVALGRFVIAKTKQKLKKTKPKENVESEEKQSIEENDEKRDKKDKENPCKERKSKNK